MTNSPTPHGLPPAHELRWRVIGPGTDDEMAALGLSRARTLVQLRRRLPLDDAIRAGIPTITTRPFDPACDVEQFLEVNNAAFAWHPDQGGWDQPRLAVSLAERWVDPDGILVHEGDDGRLDGFCWTRVHPADEADVMAADGPALGEIFVIGADPRRHGSRLGPALVTAGLDHLRDAGLGVAILYTEEENLPARRMYDRMGFEVHERRGGYR